MRQFGGRGPHDIESGAAVHVNVDETRREDGVGKVFGKIDHHRMLRDFLLSSRGNGRDQAVLNKQERVLYLFLRRIEAIGAEDNHGWSDLGPSGYRAFDPGAPPV